MRQHKKPGKKGCRSTLLRAAAALLALLVWQAAALFVGEQLLLASPLSVVGRLVSLLMDGNFLAALGFTFLRIAAGYGGAFLCGVLLGALAGRFPMVETLLFPYMITIRSVPVASFVVVALIWLSSAELSAFVSFLIVLPLIYNGVLTGVRGADPKMLEMAAVFRVPLWRRVRCIWLPALRPHLGSAAGVAIGLAWKSGVAAELIGIPRGSVGEYLYESKVYLDTATLFAVTVVIVLASTLCEKGLAFLFRRAGKEKTA